MAGQASATQYILNSGGCTSTCGLSSYGTVNVSGEGTNTLTFAIHLDPTVFINQAGNSFDTVAWDLVGNPTITVGGLPANFGTNGSQAAGSHHEDGLGFFDYVVNWTGVNSNSSLSVQDLSFTVTGTNPVLDFNTVGTDHIFFSVDIARVAPNGAVSTGVVGATLKAGVPEPATWAMMLVGFGGMGALLRHRRRQGVAAVA